MRPSKTSRYIGTLNAVLQSKVAVAGDAVWDDLTLRAHYQPFQFEEFHDQMWQAAGMPPLRLGTFGLVEASVWREALTGLSPIKLRLMELSMKLSTERRRYRVRLLSPEQKETA